MATSTQNTPPQPIQHSGLIVSAISLVLRISGLLIASLLFSILIEYPSELGGLNASCFKKLQDELVLLLFQGGA